MIIIDENVDQAIIDHLNEEKFETFSIRKHQPGITDKQVIDIAISKRGFIITEDKGFGELVFSHNIKDCSVILLRYNKLDFDNIAKNLLKVLEDYCDKPGHYFMTITKKKIRIRKL